jgi:hypothetical protein
VTALFTGVVAIVPTRRGKYFWAAWWTAPPEENPFKKPDASSGGARSHEDALREAERAAKQSLVEIDGRWAGAYRRVLRGDKPWPSEARPGMGNEKAPPKEPKTEERGASIWTILGIEPGATADAIKRAYRKRALETHPDRGGQEAQFRAVQRAYEKALIAAAKPTKRRR